MSDWNKVKPAMCAKWLVLPTVYSDALSYGEQLDKFCFQLNKIIENNNILPDYIAEMIQSYISSGAIGEVVREILANYILNVKYPPDGIKPAVGDGSEDDTEAIQGCIDYASKNGGVVYFPYGSYLSQPITMKSNVSLFGFDRYSTKIVLKGGATKALLNGNVNGLSVIGLTLDGNSGIQVNDVGVVNLTGADLLFNELIIKDGYHLFEFTGDGRLQMNDIVFGNAVENCYSVGGNAKVQAKNLSFSSLSKVGGVDVINVAANGGTYEFDSTAICDKCLNVSGNDNKIIASISNANTTYEDTGLRNNIEIIGKSEKKYYSGNISADGGSADVTLHGGVNVNANNATGKFNGNVKIDGKNSEVTLQGTRSLHVVDSSTFAVDGNSTESVDGNKSELVTGVTTETYKNTRTTNDTNLNENVTGKKKEEYGILEETVSGNKKVICESYDEQVNGIKNVTTNGGYNVLGKRFNVGTDDPMQYSKPTEGSALFNFIPMLDKDNTGYNLLVYAEKTNELNKVLTIPYANVLDYGADPTGINDSTTAIQNALRSGKKLVIIPVGTYICNSAKIPSDVTVRGYGAKLVCTNSDNILINDSDGNSGGYSANSNICVEGLDFSAPNPNNCTPLAFGHCANITIRDCNFHDIKVWHFIEINSCKNTLVDNCLFYNYGTSAGGYSEMLQLDYASAYGVFPWFGPYDNTITLDTKITNCSFLGNENLLSGRTPSAIGNHTDGEYKIVGTEISNCYFENLGSALKFVTCNEINFNENYVKACNTGVYLGGNVAYIHINNNILEGRTNWGDNAEYRGIFVEYVNQATVEQIIGNDISNFGGHGLTLQGTFVNCFNNHVHNNGMHGIYIGWADFGSKYSDNIAWGNNRLNAEGTPRYDLYFNLVRANLPAEQAIGDDLISNNKASSCFIGVQDTDNAQKILFVLNFIKGTFVKTDSELVSYGYNFNQFALADVPKLGLIGKTTQANNPTTLPIPSKSWYTIISLTIPEDGLYEIFARLETSTPVNNNYGSVRFEGYLFRDSFQYTIDPDTARYLYISLSATIACTKGQVINYQIWSGLSLAEAENNGYIIATRIG